MRHYEPDEVPEFIADVKKMVAEIYLLSCDTPYREECYNLRIKVNKLANDVLAKKQPIKDTWDYFNALGVDMKHMYAKIKDYLKGKIDGRTV